MIRQTDNTDHSTINAFTQSQLLTAVNALYSFGLTDADCDLLTTKFSTLASTLSTVPKQDTFKQWFSANRGFYFSIFVNDYLVEINGNSNISSVYGKDVQIVKLSKNDRDTLTKFVGNNKYFFRLEMPYIEDGLDEAAQFATDYRRNRYDNIFNTIIQSVFFLDFNTTDTNLVSAISKLPKNLGSLTKQIFKTTRLFNDPATLGVELEKLFNGNIDHFNSIIPKNAFDTANDAMEFAKLISGPKHTITHSKDSKYANTIGSLQSNSTVMQHIMGVVESDNIRRAVIASKNSIHYWMNAQYTLRMFPHTNVDYDYVDAQRYFISRHENANNADVTPHSPPAIRPTILGDVIFYDIDQKFPNGDILKFAFGAITASTSHLVDGNTMQAIMRKYSAKQTLQAEEAEATAAMEKKIKVKIEELKLPEGTFKLNDVTYTNSTIEYENQVLSLKGQKNWVYNLVAISTRYHQFNTLNFDILTDLFIDRIQNSLDAKTTSVNCKIGNVNVTLERKISNGKNKSSLTRYLINKVRINKDEVRQCLQKALCFNEDKDYNAFLEQVSSCSLKVHHHLHNGLILHVDDDFGFAGDDRKINLKFHIERDKNKNYLLVKGNKYNISDTNRLFNLANKPTLLHIVNELISGKSVNGVTANMIKDIIQEAKQNYQDDLDRMNSMLERTEKMFNLSVTNNVSLENGININKAYIVKGQIREYCVDAENENKVFSYPEGRYICMVDKNNVTHGVDRLINRLFALNNDKLISEEVSTLELG